MLRITITVPSTIPVERITAYRVQGSCMCVSFPGNDLPGVDYTTDITLDVEESRLPALAFSLGPTFAMTSAALPDPDGKTYQVRISGGDFDGRVVSKYTYRMDADEDCGRRNDNLGELDGCTYVVEVRVE